MFAMTHLLDNLKFLTEKNPMIAQSFASSVIKNVPLSPDGTIRLTQLHGRRLQLHIGPSKPSPNPMSHDTIVQYLDENRMSRCQRRAF